MLVDSHCHLDFDALNQNLPQVLGNADKAGVGLMLSISTKLSTFPNVRHIAEHHDTVYCTVGIHPLEAAEEGLTNAEQLMMYAEHPKVVGIGESGFDFFREGYPDENMQRQQFLAHIDAARQIQLPLVVHARAADAQMIEVLEEETQKGAFPFILHCYSSSRELAMKGLELGGYISFSGILTFPKSQELRDLARDIPVERLLVETDAPFLAPQPVRGQSCEPAHTIHTAETLADIKGLTYADLAKKTTENFLTLFDKVDL